MGFQDNCLKAILALVALAGSYVAAESPPPLTWVTASMGKCRASGLKCTSTVLSVPATYKPVGGSVKLFVKRYMTAGAKTAERHLIMLPGGPGQDESVLEGHAGNIAAYAGVPVAIYLTDMRGVGQSQAFVRPDDSSWLNSLDSVAGSAPFPLNSINMTNVAMDVLQLGKAIRDSPEFGLGAKLGIFGVSFGGTWAYRALQLDEGKIFDFAVLDSMAATSEGFTDPKNDSTFLRNCDSHPFCKAQFNGDVNNARKWLAEIVDPKTNGCAAALSATLSSGKYVEEANMGNRLLWMLQDFLEGKEAMEPDGRYHSAMVVLAFIKATHQCRDLAAYSGILKSMASGIGSLTASARARPVFPTTRAGGEAQYNRIVNYFLFCEEAFNLPGGGDGDCKASTITAQCMLRSAYMNIFSFIKSFVSARDPISGRGYSGGAKVYFVHGEADLVTPYPTVERLASKTSGSRKITYRNFGHSIITNSPCAAPTWKEVLGGGSSSTTDGCLAKVNSAPLEWTFKRYPKYRAWWDPSISPDDHQMTEPDMSSVGGGGGIPWIPIVIALIVILASGGGFFFWKTKKAATKQS